MTAWSMDNSSLYLASQSLIQRYDISTNSITDIYQGDSEISCLVTTGSSVIFSSGTRTYTLDPRNYTILNSQEHHALSITSISMSTDDSVLASASGSDVVLSTLSSGTTHRFSWPGQDITHCVFHSHTTGRLLVSSPRKLALFDTVRSHQPIKVVHLPDSTAGSITAIACSPFSKTLIAVASTGGTVGLIDLEKEKGLFKTLQLNLPITSAVFSAEGSAMYFGTANGQLAIIDLRGLEKPPRIIPICKDNRSVQCLAVQKSSKLSSTVTKKPASTSFKASSLAARRPSGLRPSPVQAESVSQVKKNSPIRKPATSPSHKIFTPAKDPLGNSTGRPSIGPSRASSGSAKPSTSSMKARSPISRSTSASKQTTSAINRVPSAKAAGSSGVSTIGSRTSAVSAGSTRRPPSMSHPGTRVQRVDPTRRPSATSTRSSHSDAASASSERPPVPSLPEKGTIGNGVESRGTPSPDLPSMTTDIPFPLLAADNQKHLQTRAISPPPNSASGSHLPGPEADSADSTSCNKGPTFQPGSPVRNPDLSRVGHDDMAMQVSPRRPSAVAHGPTWPVAAVPSPLRRSINISLPGSPGGSSAQDFLRAVVKDAMMDFHAENRAEMMGLHLDLVKMGTSWKKELRDLMDEYVGDLKSLRDENARLREENDRLRRGY